jgi:hypothetical protein
VTQLHERVTARSCEPARQDMSSGSEPLSYLQSRIDRLWPTVHSEQLAIIFVFFKANRAEEEEVLSTCTISLGGGGGGITSMTLGGRGYAQRRYPVLLNQRSVLRRGTHSCDPVGMGKPSSEPWASGTWGEQSLPCFFLSQ